MCCRQSPSVARSGSGEVARLSPACPCFHPDSSCSAGASCCRSALLDPSLPRLACRTGLALVCHQDLTPVCQRAALARNGLGERGRRWQRSRCGDCPGTTGAKSAAGLPALEPQLGPVGSVPNPGAGFNLPRIEVGLLRRSEILCVSCFPAWGTGESGANHAVLLRGASLAPSSLSPLPGQRLVSARSVLGRSPTPGELHLFQKPLCRCVVPGSFAIPLPFIRRARRRPAPNLQPDAPSA